MFNNISLKKTLYGWVFAEAGAMRAPFGIKLNVLSGKLNLKKKFKCIYSQQLH